MSEVAAGEDGGTQTDLTVCPHCGGDLRHVAQPAPPPVMPSPVMRPKVAYSSVAPPTVPVFILPRDGVECPRCGYDLGGTVRAWTDRCPIDGNCPECGLHFDWSHVLVVSKYEPKWCIEFVIGWQRTIAAAGMTLARSFVPWMFWRGLNMSSAVRWHRLRLYVYMLLAMIALAYCGVQALRAAAVYRTMAATIDDTIARARSDISEAKVRISSIEAGETRFATRWNADDELARLRGKVVRNQGIIDAPPVIEHSFIAALGEAILAPSSATSSGVIRHNDGRTIAYPAPADYFAFLSTGWAGPTGIPTIGTTAATVGLGTALVVLLPATFLLLPASRRKAKVQWRHIGRIGMYSAALPAVVCTVIVLAQGLSWLPATKHVVPGFVWSFPALLWIAVPFWWWAAVRFYLRMPHAAAIAVIMTFMILLLIAPIVLAMMPAWLEDALVAWPDS